MKLFKKLTLIFMSLAMVLMCACSSGSEKGADTDRTASEEEIESQYDAILSNAQSQLLPDGYNPITDSFTQVDFQFTMTDNTTAFNLPENSYTRITPDGASFSFIASGFEPEYFSGAFQTAKGMSFANTKDEFAASYKVTEENIYVAESGVTSFAFASEDGINFVPLLADDTKGIITISAEESVSGHSFDTTRITNEFPDYVTVAIVHLTPDSNGFLSSYEMRRFDKIEE